MSRGPLTRGAENSYLALEEEGKPIDTLRAHSITYRVAAGPNAGRKVFTLQTLPPAAEEESASVAKLEGFSLHAGVVAQAHERAKLERLVRYIPAGAEEVGDHGN